MVHVLMFLRYSMAIDPKTTNCPKTKQWVNTQKQNPHFLLLGIEIDPVYRATQNRPPPTPGGLDVCALRRHAGSFFMELWGSDVRMAI